MRRCREEINHDDAGIEYVDRDSSLLIYPNPGPNKLFRGCRITLGDLHGNALKLIYCMQRENLWQISRNQYEILKTIYLKDTNALTIDDIELFCKTIDEIPFNTIPDDMTLCLLGDEVADRATSNAGNDFFTFIVMAHIKKMKTLNFEIICSNHGVEFLFLFEKGLMTNYSYLESVGCANSTKNLRGLIQRKIISYSKLDELVRTVYLPSIKLLSYAEIPNERPNFTKYLATLMATRLITPQKTLVFFSHAYIGHHTLRRFKSHPAFKSRFKSGVQLSPNKMIDVINDEFLKIVQHGKISEKFSEEIEMKKNLELEKIPFSLVVLRCLWARGYQHDQPRSNMMFHGTLYKTFSVHGHDQVKQESVSNSQRLIVTSLDNNFGKGMYTYNENETYSVLYTRGLFVSRSLLDVCVNDQVQSHINTKR